MWRSGILQQFGRKTVDVLVVLHTAAMSRTLQRLGVDGRRMAGRPGFGMRQIDSECRTARNLSVTLMSPPDAGKAEGLAEARTGYPATSLVVKNVRKMVIELSLRHRHASVPPRRNRPSRPVPERRIAIDSRT